MLYAEYGAYAPLQASLNGTDLDDKVPELSSLRRLLPHWIIGTFLSLQFSTPNPLAYQFLSLQFSTSNPLAYQVEKFTAYYNTNII